MRLLLLSPGDPSQRTGGYLYNLRLAQALRRAGHTVDVAAIDGPWPDAPRRDPLLRVDADAVLADGLLWTGLRRYWPTHAPPVAVVVHSPLGAERPDLADAEIAALSGCRAIATGAPTQRALAAAGVDAALLIPGADACRRATRPRRGHLVVLATLTPRKQLPALLDQLAQVRAPWSLTIAGATDRDPAEAARVRARAAAFGPRVRIAGELDDDGVDALLRDADLLVHAARFEAYGMALADAMARGVATLTTPAGAAEAGGAEVVDLADLGRAADRLLADPAALDRLADRAWTAGQQLPSWDDRAQRLLSVLAREG